MVLSSKKESTVNMIDVHFEIEASNGQNICDWVCHGNRWMGSHQKLLALTKEGNIWTEKLTERCCYILENPDQIR